MLNVPVPTSLGDAVEQILLHVTPETADKPLLNAMTKRQVCHATCRAGRPYRDATDTNILVPKEVYNLTTNKAWRFPPMIRAEFSIDVPEHCIPVLHVDARFGAPQFVHYAEAESGSIDWDRVTPSLGRPPASFGDLKLNLDGNAVQYRLRSRGGDRLNKLHAPPAMIRETKSFALSANLSQECHITSGQEHCILRKWRPGSDPVDGVTPDGDLIEPHLALDPEESASLIVLHRPGVKAAIQVEVTPTSTRSVWRVAVSLLNTHPYEAKKAQERIWRSMVMLLPTLFIQVEGAKIRMSPQQHADVFMARLKDQHNPGDPAYDFAREQWLSEYSHNNSVLTRSTQLGFEDTLVLAPFGVYDTVQIVPRSGGLHRDTVSLGPQAVLNSMDLLNPQERQYLKNTPDVLDRIHRVLKGLMRAFDNGKFMELRLYQWAAIQKRIQQLLRILMNEPGARREVRVVRAPTAAGKTLVFMANAALHVAITGERAVMMFPTRILNEDMYKRLTRLVASLREELPEADFRGGLMIGQSDPLFRALTKPRPDQPMIQFGRCPRVGCKSDKIIAKPRGARIIGVCPMCGHEIDYMYDPNESAAYLPNLTIATPDKLFYQATAAQYEHLNLRFFGARSVRCLCGQYIPLDPKTKDTVVCRDDRKIVPGCGREIKFGPSDVVSHPVGYIVFDEVHSLHGLTATLLSGFLDLIYVMAFRMSGGKAELPVIETGTATIANEKALLRAITRRNDEEIKGFPLNSQYGEYFEVKPDRVRYRTLAMLPVGKSSLVATANTLMDQYDGFHRSKELRTVLTRAAGGDTGIAKYYEFALGYLFRKRDIYNMHNTLQDLFHSSGEGGKLEGIDYLSGDSGAGEVSRIMQEALEGKLKLLLANLVVSLGVDIEGLNNLVMFGFPMSVIEYVQTAGRTGRDSVHPGHVSIFLNPIRPRDMYLFRFFHQMLGDVTGYYESKPATAAGIYAADLLMPNVVKGLLTAQYIYSQRWPLSRQVASGLLSREGQLSLLRDAYPILTGPNGKERDETSREIARMLQSRLDLWRSDWGRHGGFLSEWFAAEDLLLPTLREKTTKSVELRMVDTALYNALDDSSAPPDDMGGDAGDPSREAGEESTAPTPPNRGRSSRPR